VEPISQTGEINLQDWCSYAIYLDNSKIYEGGETGNDAIDLTQTHLDLGLYKPGSSRTMQVDVVWDQGEYGDLVNGGKRLVDIDGEHILEEPSGVDYVEGETTFRWIFYAVVEPQSTPSSSSSHSHSSRRTDEDTASGSTFGFLLPQIDDVTNGIWGFLLPQTGVQSEESMWYLLMFAAAALCAVTAVLVLRKKRK
jgi:LPXTG-motif cell wall-anchored protein